MTFGEHINHNWGAHVHDDDDHYDEEYVMVPHYLRRDKPSSEPQVTEALSDGYSVQSQRAKDREDFLILLRSLRDRPQRNGAHSVDDAISQIYANKKYSYPRIVTQELNAEGRRMLGGGEVA